MDEAEFTRRHPRLYHLAHADSWPAIQEHGLLSARGLVEKAGLDVPSSQALLREKRPESVRLEVASIGTAILRDQKPLHAAKLADALTDGMTVEQWLDQLNGLVFLYPDEPSMLKLYEVYKAEPAVVLTLDSRSLARTYGARLRVAAINSGSVLYKAQPRGRGTFKGLTQYDGKRAIKEVAVMDPITDLKRHLISVEQWLPDGSRTPIEVS